MNGTLSNKSCCRSSAQVEYGAFLHVLNTMLSYQTSETTNYTSCQPRFKHLRQALGEACTESIEATRKDF